MISHSTSVVSLQKEGLLPLEEKLEISNKKKKLSIGIPKESDKNENRVALAPHAVELLINSGHKVLIETDAGKQSNFTDLMYSELGANICNNKKEVYQCDVILQISPPNIDEIDLLKKRCVLISSFSIGRQSKECIAKLQQKKITAIGYEFYKDKKGNYPIVQSMSEIAGTTSILIAAEYLSNAQNGKGEMLGGISGVSPSEIVILGADTAGEFAARTALGLGAIVKVFDSSVNKLRLLQEKIGMRLFTSILQPKILCKALKDADVVIGALFPDKQTSAFTVSEDLIKKMKPLSVIIDLYIEHGSCFETIQKYNFSESTFKKHNVVHYCVPNIPSRVARTATYAISNILVQIIEKLGFYGGINQFVKNDDGFGSGVYMYEGLLTKQHIAEKFGFSWQDINLIAGAF